MYDVKFKSVNTEQACADPGRNIAMELNTGYGSRDIKTSLRQVHVYVDLRWLKIITLIFSGICFVQMKIFLNFACNEAEDGPLLKNVINGMSAKFKISSDCAQAKLANGCSCSALLDDEQTNKHELIKN